MKSKKVILGILLLGIIFCSRTNVDAKGLENEIINHNGIYISEQEYERLEHLGFTKTQILYMTRQEYESNKNLTGEVVTEKISYFKSVNGVDEEVSKEEYDTPGISLFGMQAGYIETGAKK